MGIYLESPLSFVEECNSRLAQIAEAYEVLNDEEKCLVDYDMVLQYVYSIQKILKWILVEKTHRQQNVRKGKHDNGASLFSNKWNDLWENECFLSKVFFRWRRSHVYIWRFVLWWTLNDPTVRVLKVLAHAIVNTILWRTFLNLFMVDLVVINNNLKNGIIIVKQIELRNGKKNVQG